MRLNLDVHKDLTQTGFGWEITDENDGGLVDSKYGFRTEKAAERAGQTELDKLLPKATGSKKAMFENFRNGYESDDFSSTSRNKETRQMYYAMYAFENYGDATRDNTFAQLVSLGRSLEREG